MPDIVIFFVFKKSELFFIQMYSGVVLLLQRAVKRTQNLMKSLVTLVFWGASLWPIYCFTSAAVVFTIIEIVSTVTLGQTCVNETFADMYSVKVLLHHIVPLFDQGFCISWLHLIKYCCFWYSSHFDIYCLCFGQSFVCHTVFFFFFTQKVPCSRGFISAF